jgi:ubiquinone/menaquinone biosynthesis C-methylase UbiE
MTLRRKGFGPLPPVLDACCGPRMFWFDHKDRRAMFVDKRKERHLAADCSVKNGEREIIISPDLVADFTSLPFPDNQFHLVVFDPPHIQRNGDTSWLLKKYGVLRGNWREEIRKGFAECFRVLKPFGTLVFKWNEDEVSVPEILSLTPEKPLFGSRYGKHFKSHWIVFLKPQAAG